MKAETKDKLYDTFEAARPVAKDVLMAGLPAAAATKILFPTDTPVGRYAPIAALATGTGLSFMDRKLKEHKDQQMNPSLTKQANLDDRVGANRSQLAELYPTASCAPGQLDPKTLFMNQERGVDPFSLFQGGRKEGSAPSLVGASLFQGHVKEAFDFAGAAKLLAPAAKTILPGAAIGAGGGFLAGGPDHRMSGALAGAGVGALGGGALHAAGGLTGVQTAMGRGLSAGSKTEAGVAARAAGRQKAIQSGMYQPGLPQLQAAESAQAAQKLQGQVDTAAQNLSLQKFQEAHAATHARPDRTVPAPNASRWGPGMSATQTRRGQMVIDGPGPGVKPASAPCSALWASIQELQKESSHAVLLEAQDKAKRHSQKDGDTLKHIGAREPNAHLTLAAERANAECTDLVNVLIKHAPENRTRVEKQLTGLLSHKGYGRTRAFGRTRSDVESEITRAFSR